MPDKYIVSSSPHIIKKESIPSIMWTVNVALLPAGLIGIFVFGRDALWLALVCIASAVAAEALIQKGRGQKVTISDGSAFMTGLLLAYNLPPHGPLWLGVVGSFFAVAVAKQAFGGLGRNIFNPALAGRAFLLAAWPQHMTTFTKPFIYDAVTQATPLNFLKEGDVLVGRDPASMNRVFEKLGNLTDSVSIIVTRLKNGEGTVGKLLTDDSIYKNLEAFTEDIKNNPWKLLNKPRGQ